MFHQPKTNYQCVRASYGRMKANNPRCCIVCRRHYASRQAYFVRERLGELLGKHVYFGTFCLDHNGRDNVSVAEHKRILKRFKANLRKLGKEKGTQWRG